MRLQIMRRFAKWHIWLGWLVGIPILMWTVSGLVMIIQPIETVRGEHLRAEAPLIPAGETATLHLEGAARSVTLLNFPDGPGWVVVHEDGQRARYSPEDGQLVAPPDEDAVRAIAEAGYTGGAALENVRLIDPQDPPTDFRAPVPAWQVHFADGTNVYVHRQTGEVLALRTSWWRVYDFMWGLHIMDLQTREDFNHPTLIVFAALGAIGSLLGCVLMFRRRKARVRV